MFNATASNMLALNSMDQFLRQNLVAIDALCAPIVSPPATPLDRYFHPLTMDWHAIVSQLPVQHKPYPFKKEF